MYSNNNLKHFIGVLWSIIESDGTRKERFPVCSSGHWGLNESVAEAALKLVQSFVEWVRGFVHDCQQFCQHPVLRHLLQG